MTTAWSYVMHCDLRNALRTHVSGTLLAGAAMAGSLAAASMAASGRKPAWRPSDQAIMMTMLATGLLILIEWRVSL